MEIEIGVEVAIHDENGDRIVGRIVGRGAANDGTGRWEYDIAVGTAIYGREEVDIDLLD